MLLLMVTFLTAHHTSFGYSERRFHAEDNRSRAIRGKGMKGRKVTHGRGMKRLVVGIACLLPTITHAQTDCGTITRSIRLTQDCKGPLVIGAHNVTLDLNGHTVTPPDYSEEVERAAVEVFGKHGVTVKNGTIEGLSLGLYVTGGYRNKFTRLVVDLKGADSSGGRKIFAGFENVTRTVVDRVRIDAYEDTNAFRFSGNRSTLSRLSLSSIDGYPVAIISGTNIKLVKNAIIGGNATSCAPTRLYLSRSKISGNTISGYGGPAALCLTGDSNTMKLNTVRSTWGSGFRLVQGRNTLFLANEVSTEQRDPPDHVDIAGGPDACLNTWRHNDFVTDSEGNGPNAGCIQ